MFARYRSDNTIIFIDTIDIDQLLQDKGPHFIFTDGPAAGWSPLHIAVIKARIDLVASLINQGVDPNIPIASGHWECVTPLYLAADFGHSDIANFLIEHGADCNAPIASGFTARNGMTPLYVAAWHGHLDVVKVLVKHGADYNSSSFSIDGTEYRPIYEATPYAEIVKLLLSLNVDFKSPLSSGPYEGRTPFYHAAIYGRIDSVKLFIEYGANFKRLLWVELDGDLEHRLRIRPAENYLNLFASKRSDFLEVVRLLTDTPADYQNLLYNAILENDTAFASALIQRCRIDLNTPVADGDHKGQTLIDIAYELGRTEIIDLIIFAAARSGDIAVFNSLVQSGVEFNIPLEDGLYSGFTPVYLAAHFGQVDIVDLIVSTGIAIDNIVDLFNCPNSNSKTFKTFILPYLAREMLLSNPTELNIFSHSLPPQAQIELQNIRSCFGNALIDALNINQVMSRSLDTPSLSNDLYIHIAHQLFMSHLNCKCSFATFYKLVNQYAKSFVDFLTISERAGFAVKTSRLEKALPPSSDTTTSSEQTNETRKRKLEENDDGSYQAKKSRQDRTRFFTEPQIVYTPSESSNSSVNDVKLR